MPAKGGQAQLSDEAVAAAVAHMLQTAGVEVE
jgi:cytochrome c5